MDEQYKFFDQIKTKNINNYIYLTLFNKIRIIYIVIRNSFLILIII